MRCPFCSESQTKVVDSREAQDGQVIRRRRECEKCTQRFTTYERLEELMPLIVKKDGRREAFDRTKVLRGLERACEKRPVSAGQLEALVQEIGRKLQSLGEKEVPSSAIGEAAMAGLAGLDQVAYVRFASVYRRFQDITEFMSELQEMLHERTQPVVPKPLPRST